MCAFVGQDEMFKKIIQNEKFEKHNILKSKRTYSFLQTISVCFHQENFKLVLKGVWKDSVVFAQTGRL